MGILTDKEKVNLRQYKYSGGDLSLTYKHVLSPLAQFCVDNFIPTSMAPNLITFVGLMVAFSATVLTLVFNPTLSADCPRWLSAYSGISIFIYQTLDNMDGKQARRTGSSSPLGMLFDHGCDAINAAISTISYASVLGAGWTPTVFLFLYCAFTSFYIQTWEEYYVGSMILPIFNGPSEGLLITASIGVVGGIVGPRFFSTPSINLSFLSHLIPNFLLALFDLDPGFFNLVSPSMCILWFGAIWGSIIVITQIVKVLRIANSRGYSVGKAILDLVPFVFFFWNMFTYVSSSSIAFQVYPRVTFMMISAIFVDMVTHLMLMHICHSPIKPFQRYFAYATYLLTVVVYFSQLPQWQGILTAIQAEKWLLQFFAWTSMLYTTTILCRLCVEIADDLGIYVFVLGKKHQ